MAIAAASNAGPRLAEVAGKTNWREDCRRELFFLGMLLSGSSRYFSLDCSITPGDRISPVVQESGSQRRAWHRGRWVDGAKPEAPRASYRSRRLPEAVRRDETP